MFEGDFGVVDVLAAIRVPFRFPPRKEKLEVRGFNTVNRHNFDGLVHGKDPGDLPVFGDDARIQMMMCGELTLLEHIYRFQFVLLPLRIHSIIAFASGNHFQTRDQQNLQQLAAVVLEDIINAMLGGEHLNIGGLWAAMPRVERGQDGPSC
jgi:hypothetical protein